MDIIIPVAVGLLMGLFSGLLGVGGGIILIPILVLGFNMSQHLAQGISLTVIIPTALSGLITYHRQGYVNYRMALLLAIGAVLGALLSAGYVHYIPAGILKKLFGVFLAIIGIRMLLAAPKIKQCARENQEE